MTERRILLIEDDVQVKSLVEASLRLEGFALDHDRDGFVGLQKAQEGKYALVLLDVNLPSLEGWEVCKRLRENGCSMPIIMLTGRKEELERVQGLTIGADDYLTKPFSVPELIARIKAVLRRTEVAHAGEDECREQETLDFGDLVIDLGKRKVTLRGEKIDLTRSEFDVLAFLAHAPGRPFSRAQMLQAVNGFDAEAYEVNINQFIVRVRQKLEANPKDPRYIRTVRGIGYRFAEREELDPE